MAHQVLTAASERTSETQSHIPDGEGAVIAAFIAVPTIWASLIVPLTFCDVCHSRQMIIIAGACLLGAAAAGFRELVLARVIVLA